MSWFDVHSTVILPGNPLFSLHVRALAHMRLSEVLQLQNNRIKAEAYGATDGTSKLQLEFDAAVANLRPQAIWAPQPNPTSDRAELALQLETAEKVVLSLTDLAGKVVYQTSVNLPAGNHLLEIPAIALENPGFYSWRVIAGVQTASGKLVRL